MRGAPAAWAALVVLATGTTRAAPASPEIAVSFGLPVDRRSVAAQLCLAEDVCGGFDADGLLPLTVHAPKGSMVWVGEVAATATPRGHRVRVDPMLALLDRSLEAAASPGRVPHVALTVRVEGPALAAERTLELKPTAMFVRTIERHTLAAGGAPRPWAAAYDAARDAEHPTLVVSRWMVDGRERDHDDVFRVEPASVIADELGTKVRDLELVATVRITPKLLERCKRCALGDFAWPEVEFRCARVRLDSEVTVVAARSGQPVATRKFQGPPPGPCGENVDHLRVRGERSPEINDWLRREVVRSRRP